MTESEAQAKIDTYVAEARSWGEDRVAADRASKRTAWLIAGAATVVAVLEAFALIALTPLKTVVPYTLLVDRQTGYVQALRPLDPAVTTADAALTQSFLVQYVLAREGYDIDTLQREYRRVMLWSAGDARRDYASAIQISNPDSPLARLPRSAIIDVRIKSVSPLSASSALVRFDTIRRDARGGSGTPQPWVATLRFAYTGEPLSIEDRMINPLGFKVTRYRRNMEALPAVTAEPLAVPATVIPNADLRSRSGAAAVQ